MVRGAIGIAIIEYEHLSDVQTFIENINLESLYLGVSCEVCNSFIKKKAANNDTCIVCGKVS